MRQFTAENTTLGYTGNMVSSEFGCMMSPICHSICTLYSVVYRALFQALFLAVYQTVAAYAHRRKSAAWQYPAASRVTLFLHIMTVIALLLSTNVSAHALMQSNRVLTVAATAATGASAQATAGQPSANSTLKLRLMAADLPPYVDGFAEGQGVVPPLVQQALAPHFQVETILTSWSTLLASAKAPRHLLLYWQRNVELEKEWYFSEPLLSQRYGFFYLAASPIAANAANLQRLSQLQDYRIGVLAGMHYGREFERAQNVLKRIEFGSELAILQALQQGQIELALIDVVQAKQLIIAQSQRKIHRLPQLSLTVDQLYLLCSRNYLPCHEILLQFQQGWQQLTTDGTLDSVLAIDVIGTT